MHPLPDNRVVCLGGRDDDPLMLLYHDGRWDGTWGILGEDLYAKRPPPAYKENMLFEHFLFALFNQHLSLRDLLHCRGYLRKAFGGPHDYRFDASAVAELDADDITRLTAAPHLGLNRSLVEAAVHNARCLLVAIQEYSGFDQFIWQFVNYHPTRNWSGVTKDTVRSRSPQSDAMAADLAARGFQRLDSETCYTFMQATGMVNDHADDCWLALRPRPRRQSVTPPVIRATHNRGTLLITMTGRKSGQPRTRPLPAWEYQGHYFLVASNGGKDWHPDWYLNLRANPQASVRLLGPIEKSPPSQGGLSPKRSGVEDSERGPLPLRAREATPAERQAILADFSSVDHVYNELQATSAREIPILILVRT